jgi:hypothetical protein
VADKKLTFCELDSCLFKKWLLPGPLVLILGKLSDGEELIVESLILFINSRESILNYQFFNIDPGQGPFFDLDC